MSRGMKRKRLSASSRLRDTAAGGFHLTGQLLIAMPGMRDLRFNNSVVYLCAHGAEGAMGLVVNKVMDSLTVPELLAHLEVPAPALKPAPVHFGGPMETARGFVLHTGDYAEDSTLTIAPDFALTTTLDVLRAIGRGDGPRRALLALGFASWAPGQLDAEIQANAWLHGPANADLVFDQADDSKWTGAIAALGIDLTMLSTVAGHA